MERELVITTQPIIAYRISLQLGPGMTYQDPVTGVNLSVEGYAGGSNEVGINITWPGGGIPSDARIVRPGDTLALEVPYSQLPLAVEFGNFRGDPQQFTIDMTLTSV